MLDPDETTRPTIAECVTTDGTSTWKSISTSPTKGSKPVRTRKDIARSPVIGREDIMDGHFIQNHLRSDLAHPDLDAPCHQSKDASISLRNILKPLIKKIRKCKTEYKLYPLVSTVLSTLSEEIYCMFIFFSQHRTI